MTKERIHRELATMLPNSNYGIVSHNSTMTSLKSFIKGPCKSPYEGGYFMIDIEIPEDYPKNAPQIYFKTKIYHPNIDEEGRINIDVLNEGWSMTITLKRILEALYNLLKKPNKWASYSLAIYQEFQDQYSEFEKKAKAWTQEYAKIDEEKGEVHGPSQEAKVDIVEETEETEIPKKLFPIFSKNQSLTTASTQLQVKTVQPVSLSNSNEAESSTSISNTPEIVDLDSPSSSKKFFNFIIVHGEEESDEPREHKKPRLSLRRN